MAETVRPAPLVLDSRLPGLVKPASTDRLSLLVYGAPGVGKTVLAGTAEDDERSAPVLFCDLEKGTMSISHRGRALDVFPMVDFSDSMNTLVRYFRTRQLSGEIPYRTVVLDSVTEAADKAMKGMLAKPNSQREDPDSLGWTEWTPLYNKIRNAVTFFRDLNVHIIFTALERTVDGKVMPSMPGKLLAPKLPAHFNTLARLIIESVKVPADDGQSEETIQQRRLVLQSHSQFVAKDRSDRMGLMPRSMIDPTVTKLLDRIEEGRRLAADRLTQTTQ